MSLTIYDISEKAGVSIATVSRVLNGSSKVKESTRKKIMDIIDEYGYTPNSSARAMGLKSMRTIGILCADSSLQKQFIILNRTFRQADTSLSCAAQAIIWMQKRIM